ncbi:MULTISPECIES: phage tail protein [unclassified Nocardia]|uniref:phage tail protein n=1 Tax=unclassified Nocardia TaxID=2637762 RepID=UPI00278C1196|nr:MULTISPECIES: phage tail protein [unclassified Nocardia]
MADPAVIEVTGVDGSRWVLSGQGQGEQGVELATSPTGLYDAPVTTQWVSSAFQYGATHVGTDWLKRDVVFSVNVFATASASWEEVDSAWRLAWDYDRDATLSISTEYGTRRLRLRMSEQPNHQVERDPRLSGTSRITMTTTAGVPWWIEDDITYTAVSTVDTRDEGVSETLWLPVSNPTDRPMWLRWACTAPGVWTLPDFSWKPDEYAARTVTMPTLAAGQAITVDTDPMEELVVAADGSSVWARMGGVLFLHAVPPRTAETLVPVTVSGAAAGAAVQVRCPRNWSRPWGLR